MTTLAKIAANRRNASFSTGPRTAAGKMIVAGNAVKHGIFANLPVVPGENPYDWEVHRAGILASLAPVGLLEVTLAERAALLLWQLARLGRYQAAVITAGVEDAGLPPPGADILPAAFFAPGQRNDEHLRGNEQNIRMEHRSHTELLRTSDLLHRLGDPAGAESICGESAESLLSWAYRVAADYPLRRFEPELYIDPGFLSRIGIGVSCMCAICSSIGVPVNGAAPVSTSYARIPSEY